MEESGNAVKIAVVLCLASYQCAMIFSSLWTENFRQVILPQEMIKILICCVSPGFLFYLKSWYIDECNRRLNDAKFYRKLDGDITVTIQQRVTVYIERMFNDGYIDEKTKKYLVQTNVKPGRFYMLPKIHKTGNPGRPIVSSNSHPTGTHLTICWLLH